MAVAIYRTSSSVSEGGTATFFATGLTANTSYTPALGTSTVTGATTADVIADIDSSSLNGAALKSVKSDANGIAVFSIKLKQDASTEGTESLSLTVGGATSGIIKVYDSSTTPATAVIPSALSVGEGGSVTYSISAADGTYTYSLSSSTATVTSDYTVTTPSSGTSVTVKNGVGTVVVKTIADSSLEGPETLALTLLSGASTVATAAPVTINDTSIGVPTLTPSVTAVNEGSSVIFTLSNVAPGSYPFTISGDVTATAPTTSDINAGLADVSSLTGTLTVASGKTSVAATIPLLKDSVTEGTEALTLTLGTPTGGGTASAEALASSVMVTDSSKAYSYKLTPSSASVSEGNTVLFNITDGKPGATVAYAVSAVAATSTTGAAAAGDFSATSGGAASASFPTGSVTIGSDGKGTFSIFTVADTVKDGASAATTLNEKFQVVLNDAESSPVNIAVVGTNTVTINDTSIA